MDNAKEYESSLKDMAKANSDNEPHVLTLAMLKDLIESKNFDQIPNNKMIQNKVNVGLGIQSAT